MGVGCAIFLSRSMSSDQYLQKIEGFREFIERACLAAFVPKRLRLRKYDEELAESIEKRWSGQVIKVRRLIYERKDSKKAPCDTKPAAQPAGSNSGEPGSTDERSGNQASSSNENTTAPKQVSAAASENQPESEVAGDLSGIGEVGDSDSNHTPPLEGTKVEEKESKDFLVFLDPHLEIDWTCDFDPPDDAKKLIASAEASAAVDCDFLAKQSLIGYRLQLGQVIVCALQGQFCEGQRLLAEATIYLNKRVVERSRQWTLYALLIFGLTALFLTAYAVGGISELQTPGPFLGGLEGGFLGAFISVAAKTGRAECDAAAGWVIHFLEVLMRLAIGLVFGGVAVGLANSSMGPEPLKLLTASPEGILILSFASGLFQQSVPRMLSEYTPLKQTSEP